MQSLALADETKNLFQQVLDAAIPIGVYQLHWTELIAVLIGVVSAWFGMRRRVWAWPVGIVANVMLFFVYLGALFGADERVPLFGQAGRQVFFILMSAYGWWRWTQVRRLSHAEDRSGAAITPRWATSRERVAVVGFWLVGTVAVHQAFTWLWSLAPNPFWTPEWWFFWCDAWIFVGSVVATFAMARGWNEFWLAWIAVDLVGVPFGFATGYVPTAVLYSFYGLFVVYGFIQWVQVSRTEHRDVEPVLAGSRVE
ncbi:nicotinamide riboside transporter PnuC [Intrasporangium calvum]|uniref:Nicotinamide mononucleotide transporter PnuC n=1 Tax=Intrasporangium calvum (strain ATCC 23552 / DSM 43043 / JCM 3097 / NBRC 12989 / NCIMB 10167 / NRRL B-3866 / 7 KIP) TaxID=710696 RepID=E6S8Z6_INTC7|nr:nicotinamide riboside transporter PnuC [Intrasporangium calvum]ADU48133.1 nicotinamide mononucleotide transporter PnuC [Intrasporangium calvum DSM 43043]AXG13202.1 nicotinamide riboside transporter PnuC [Intrasporangium calvum]